MAQALHSPQILEVVPGQFATMDGLDLAFDKNDDRSKVHIRMQQRNGRKSWTTVQGVPDHVRLPKSGKRMEVDFEKILRALKKSFKTNGTLIHDAEHGKII